MAADVVSFRLWPPVAIGLPLAIGEAVTLVAGDPVSLPPARVPVGVVLVAVFAVWNGWSLLLFRRHRTGLLPGQATRTVMVSGPFAVSRNPLYVGLLVLHLGVALLLPSVWALVLWPVAVVLVDWGAIRPEERFLRQRFGPAYDEYAGRVRRWL
jgi:protein-S-isoprenylcysteine O-methyltransferase Ste14